VALVLPEPVAASDSSWLTVSDGFASFVIPAGHVPTTRGAGSPMMIEGNFGPSSNLAELGLTLYGDAWTATIGPLIPGLYYYRITADDTKVVDGPALVSPEPTWRTFFIPGESVRLLADVPAGQGGTIGKLAYTDGTPHQQRYATVWTPPGYDPRRPEPYPVLYLLPDADGDASAWVELGRAKQIFDNLCDQGRMKPMVVVMGNRSLSDPQGGLRKVMEAARRAYNVARESVHQAVAGPSAGGAAALHAALTDPGEFAYAGSFGGLFADDGPPLDAVAVNAGTKLLRLYAGNVTDPAYNPTYRLIQKLTDAGVSYEFGGIHPGAGHNWTAWRDNLIDLVPRLFGPSDHQPCPGHLPLNRELSTPDPGTTPAPWLVTEANGDTFATFETTTEFADARHVTLWGNWTPGGSWLRLPLTRCDNRWQVTVGPLKPWFYYYQYFVDSIAHKDSANPAGVTSEPTWSPFVVPGESAHLVSDVLGGQGGALRTLTYHSSVANEERKAYVWTPPGYDPGRDTPYPVLYLQHGSGQSYTDWVEMGRARQILDNQFLDGNLAAMVVVMGNGNVTDFPRELLDNIVPAARESYTISHEPARQALAGLSMGGFQTYDVLKSHPGEFAYLATFSAGLWSAEGLDAAAINERTKSLRVYCGDVTDFLYTFVMNTLATFGSLGIKYEFDGPTPGPHGWDTWQKNLIDFAPRLFRDDTDQPEAH
jgi:enterochelin esterase-like enzyme